MKIQLRRALALGMAISVLALTVVSPAVAAETAALQGKILDADGLSPRAGVVVSLVDENGETLYRSEQSDAQGRFSIDAQAGNFGLVASTDEGAYLAAEEFAVNAGSNEAVVLALKPTTSLAPGQQAAAKGASKTTKYIIAGVLVVAGVFLIDELSEDEEETSSPF